LLKKIVLTKGKTTLVDDALYDELNQYSWCASLSNGKWYAVRRKKIKGRPHKVYMHRELLCVPKDM
jgi:hypothetical protein